MNPQHTPSAPFQNIFISGLAPDVTVITLAEFFRDFGPISSVRVPISRDGGARGFGFVGLPLANAESACEMLSGLELLGHKVYVRVAWVKDSRLQAIEKR